MKSHFKFNKQERSGIFFLLLIIVLLQGVFFLMSASTTQKEDVLVLNASAQSQLDSLRLELLNKKPKIFPFNPNYINDYKGYSLGMSPEEIDRLLAYRAQNRYVNSAEEFQQVTKVSDSLLQQVGPYFRFPEWKNRPQNRYDAFPSNQKINTTAKKDLNKVSAEELRVINGIGDVLSQRIIKFRNRLGGFITNEQLYDIYGLESEVVARTLERFDVITKPDIVRINLNKASASELSQLIYINKELAQQIVAFREANGSFNSLDELLQIQDFPKDRIERIKLYLQL